MWLFSIYNEINNPVFWQNLDFLLSHNQNFLIIDGESDDGTREKLQALLVNFHVLSQSSRGARFHFALENFPELNLADYVVFMHPRSLIGESHLKAMHSLPSNYLWGAFTHQFDHSHILLKLISWWSNHMRGDLGGIFYLDHILWAKKDSVHSFPTSPIFEDTLFSKQMKKIAKPKRLSPIAVTSAKRFLKNGILRQFLLNQKVKIHYFLGKNFHEIDREYEKGLELNRKI